MSEYPNSFIAENGQRVYTCKRCGREFTPNNKPGDSGPSTLYCSREDCRRARARTYMRERRRNDKILRAVAHLERAVAESSLDNKTATKIYERINKVNDQICKLRNCVANERNEMVKPLEAIKDLIEAERKRLEAYLDDAEHDPIMVIGETRTGYECQIMVDPAEIAKIMLEYNYPTWKVLEEDLPNGMWNDIALKLGLESVSSVDL